MQFLQFWSIYLNRFFMKNRQKMASFAINLLNLHLMHLLLLDRVCKSSSFAEIFQRRWSYGSILSDKVPSFDLDLYKIYKFTCFNHKFNILKKAFLTLWALLISIFVVIVTNLAGNTLIIVVGPVHSVFFWKFLAH